MSQLAVQLGEAGLVVVDDCAERLAVGRDVRPKGMAGHGGKVELLPRERQRPLQAAVPVADPTVVVDVAPEELILHSVSSVCVIRSVLNDVLRMYSLGESVEAQAKESGAYGRRRKSNSHRGVS